MKKLLTILMLLVCPTVFALDTTETIPANGDPALNTQQFNDELRKTSRRLIALEGGLDLGGTMITGVLPLSKGGLNNALTDPNADRIYFWDDSEGVTDWLTVGNGLSITTTTLAVNENDLNIPVVIFKNPLNGTQASCTGIACTDTTTDIIDTRTDWSGKRLSFEGSVTVWNMSAGGTPAQDDIDDIHSTSATAVTGYPFATTGATTSEQVYSKFFWTASTTNKTFLSTTDLASADVSCDLDVNGSGQLVLVTNLTGNVGGGNTGNCRLDDVVIIREP